MKATLQPAPASPALGIIWFTTANRQPRTTNRRGAFSRRGGLLAAAIAALAVALLPPAAHADEVLCGFTDPADVGAWKGAGFGLKMAEGSALGDTAAEVSFTAEEAKIAMDRIPKDWSGFSHLTTSLLNTGKDPLTVSIRLLDAERKGKFSQPFKLAPGQKTEVRIALADVKDVNLKNMARVVVLREEPKAGEFVFQMGPWNLAAGTGGTPVPAPVTGGTPAPGTGGTPAPGVGGTPAPVTGIGTPGPGAVDQPLSRFAGPADEAAWKASGGTLKVVADSPLGGPAARIAFSKGEANVYTSKLPRDWTRFKAVSTALWNPGKDPLRVGIRLLDGARKAFTKEFELKPGEKTEISLDLAEVKDIALAQMKRFTFVRLAPKEGEVTFDAGPILLTGGAAAPPEKPKEGPLAEKPKEEKPVGEKPSEGEEEEEGEPPPEEKPAEKPKEEGPVAKAPEEKPKEEKPPEKPKEAKPAEKPKEPPAGEKPKESPAVPVNPASSARVLFDFQTGAPGCEATNANATSVDNQPAPGTRSLKVEITKGGGLVKLNVAKESADFRPYSKLAADFHNPGSAILHVQVDLVDTEVNKSRLRNIVDVPPQSSVKWVKAFKDMKGPDDLGKLNLGSIAFLKVWLGTKEGAGAIFYVDNARLEP